MKIAHFHTAAGWHTVQSMPNPRHAIDDNAKPWLVVKTKQASDVPVAELDAANHHVFVCEDEDDADRYVLERGARVVADDSDRSVLIGRPSGREDFQVIARLLLDGRQTIQPILA